MGEAAADLACRIDAVLPQTQCGQCGFEACRPYAEALAAGTAAVDLCPPGGEAVRARLVALTGIAPDPSVRHAEPEPRVAFVREGECIGCTRCIRVCPVDAIVGAAGQMHTVVAEWCTGCERCVPACPTDCIDLVGPPAGLAAPGPDAARSRYEARRERLARHPYADDDGYVDLGGQTPGELGAAVLAAVRRRRGETGGSDA
ncbi:MAG: RnfABCDGE type electron transport complex subunit B [Gammaproteobacteria bacterium]